MLSSCDKNDGVVSPESEPVGNISAEQVQYDPQMEAIAKALAASMGEESVRTLIKTEALKKFDGDYDILYQKIGNQNVGGKTLSSLLNENSQKGNEKSRTLPISQFAVQMPLLNIGVPVNAEKWNTSNFEPLVVISPSSVVKDETKLTVVKAYDKAGKVHWLDAKKTPDFPVVVVGLNERVKVLANGQTELKKGLVFASNGEDKKQVELYENPDGGGGGGGGGGGTPTCTRPNNSDEYIINIRASNGDAWEGWFDGGPEFTLQIAGASNNTQPNGNNIPQIVGNSFPFNYDNNYHAIEGNGADMNAFLIQWDDNYGGILSYVWREEDTGGPTGFTEPVKIKALGKDILDTNILMFFSWGADPVGTFPVYRTHCSPFVYGTPTFNFKITHN